MIGRRLSCKVDGDDSNHYDESHHGVERNATQTSSGSKPAHSERGNEVPFDVNQGRLEGWLRIQGVGLGAQGVLPQILPYLVIKHEVARRMLEFLEFVETNSVDGLEKVPRKYYEKVDALYWGVKELNQKGKDLTEEELALAAVPFNPNQRRPGNRRRTADK
jgi:hypothetical protein